MSKSVLLAKNGKARLGDISETNQTKLWLIEWEINNLKYTNHYLAYKPVIQLKEYTKWLPILKH